MWPTLNAQYKWLEAAGLKWIKNFVNHGTLSWQMLQLKTTCICNVSMPSFSQNLSLKKNKSYACIHYEVIIHICLVIQKEVTALSNKWEIYLHRHPCWYTTTKKEKLEDWYPGSELWTLNSELWTLKSEVPSRLYKTEGRKRDLSFLHEKRFAIFNRSRTQSLLGSEFDNVLKMSAL